MNAINDILRPILKTHTLSQVARIAAINLSHLSDVRAGRRPATAALLYRLGVAVRQLKQAGLDPRLVRPAIYRVVLALTADALGLNVLEVLRSEPGAKRAANKEWRDASFARWLAQYLLNTRLNMKQAEVARASGVTKQAVSLAMREIENRRDDPAFEQVLAHMEIILRGDLADAQ